MIGQAEMSAHFYNIRLEKFKIILISIIKRREYDEF